MRKILKQNDQRISRFFSRLKKNVHTIFNKSQKMQKQSLYILCFRYNILTNFTRVDLLFVVADNDFPPSNFLATSSSLCFLCIKSPFSKETCPRDSKLHLRVLLLQIKKKLPCCFFCILPLPLLTPTLQLSLDASPSYGPK